MKDKIKDILTVKNGYLISEERVIPYGYQLRLTTGAVVNIYEKGTVTVQGKNTEAIRKLCGLV